MKRKITLLLIIGFLLLGLLMLREANAAVDYTGRNLKDGACELFAVDASQAAERYAAGQELQKILDFIDQAKVPPSKRERAFQAIQFVWKNQLDDPQLAYTLAMGHCVKPKDKPAPLDEPWLTSPRTFENSL